VKNLRDFVLAGLLLAIGLVLHYVTPSTGTPVKPDFLLAMLFLCLLTFEDTKVGFVAGVAAGILSGLTTNVPGGFVPNLIDKLITTGVLIVAVRVSRRFINQYILSIAVPIAGTILSGCVFIGSAILLEVFPPQIFVGNGCSACNRGKCISGSASVRRFEADRQTLRQKGPPEGFRSNMI
jgi:hypothetical protein